MRKSKHGKRQEVLQNKKLDFDNNPYADELEVPYKTKIYTGIFVAVLLLITVIIFFSTDMVNKQNADTMLERVLTEEQTIIDRKGREDRSLELETLSAQADSAFQTSDYFAAVFFYRQALAINETDISLQEKLIAALKFSCESGHDLHCKAIDSAEEILLELKGVYGQ